MVQSKIFYLFSGILLGIAGFIFISGTLISPDFIYPQRIDSAYFAYKILEDPSIADSIVLTPDETGLSYQKITVVTADSLKLSGWYVAANDTPANTILIIPDLNQSKILYIDHLKQFHDRGWNVAVVDMRAHGESEGIVYTPGVTSVDDVRLIINDLHAIDSSSKIIIHGIGMGAAIAMQVAVYDGRPQAYILENPPSELTPYLDRYTFRQWGKLKWLWKPLFYRKVERLLGYRIQDLDLVKIAGYIDVPTLFLSGTQNNIIFTSEVLRIYSASAAVKKDLFLVRQAGQDNMARIGGEKYYNKISSFLLNAVPKKPKKTRYKKLAMQ
jgi:alpha-beta hydrolase superfamily lysophospholipase